jgi:hypothetical protein
MLRLSLWLLGAALAFPVTGCTATVTSTAPGTVAQDGSVYLGFTLVSRKQGEDWMLVGERHGYFSSVRFSVEDRPLGLDKMVLEFGGGEQWTAPLSGEFAPGSWSPEVQLPSPKTIRKVTYYGRTKGKKGLMAKVSLYGQR